MSGAVAALGFLTRVPLGPLGRLAAGAGLGAAAPWFPLVGALVGAIAGGTRLLADLALPAGPSTALAIAAAVIVTGGLHEDGLADSADGLAAHASRERRLEIMRDPRVGTFGVLALVLVLGLAWSLLAPLDGGDCLAALVVAHALARWATVAQAAVLPPARRDGSGARLRPGLGAALVATAVAVAGTLVLAGPGPGGLAVAVAALVAVAVAVAAMRAFGGATGDTYGASAKLVEVAVLAALVAAWGA